jgi:hypothetical protein
VLPAARRTALRALLRRLAGPARLAAPPRRRLLLVQLDGVSRARLDAALGRGLLPALAGLLDGRGHRLTAVRAVAPASTPAYQAALFYGRTPSVPGFRWIDRATRRVVRMDRASDATRFERGLAASAPGLLRGGSASLSLFCGGAARRRYCISTLAPDGASAGDGARGVADGAPVAAALVRSAGLVRGMLSGAGEAGAGAVDGLRWSRAVGRGRHELRFLGHRIALAGLFRDTALHAILVDLAAGLPAVFVDLLAFDSAAHRRGPEAPVAARRLAAMDGALALLLEAAAALPELGYEVVVLSDHGHVATVPFERVAGASLEEVLARAEPGVSVAEAGDLAHLYFLDDPGPLPLEAIRRRHGRVLAALAACPGVGLVAARGRRRGVVLVGGAALDLADPRDVARLPHPDPAAAAAALSAIVSLRDAGDLVAFGWRDVDRPSVAFAWEFGSHGGIAPEELDCFVVHRSDAALPAGPLSPLDLHRWLEDAREDGARAGAARTGDDR